ncbi:1,4-dihydroxy-2-naphthoate polyprenyltransferase [Grimontia hollisae]|nr:1,4-dihydroxy-2-naphthoate polyprenyltransferase [Grimontia hollisae]AMG30422.1 1,4-dihydroxy-2-naphthoate polyprenyltransferase [Grimontia hollisae]MDF2183865.1 1,4-dihydroxy-2-naphthoate polyprenyltransferase [Grimontia hollisae]STO41993.1 1,4-dihydroxy-2-naphthoate octaprenyltransferase [Grimontia hollisae]STQ77760.1 1,4-dihydroxy-2-naphthoate octaprenyltransferase [Grimontia hollisae]
MSSSTLKTWLDAARPKTLPLAIACILCGSAVAAQTAQFSFTLTALALVTALLLQILSNLANDYGDAVKGTDNEVRLGPKRTIQQGLITPQTMKKAMAVNVILTVTVGATLILTAFDNATDILSFVGLGALAIVAAICYTVGNKPYGYKGLGDLSVLIFFGWLGVAGTYYLQAGTLNTIVLLPATACGLLAVGVLNINNLRDIDNDRACGKHTLVVRMGPKWGRTYHQILLATAFACFALFALIQPVGWHGWLFILVLPLAIKHGYAVMTSPDGESLRPMMGDMVQVALLTNALFAAGILLH